VDLTIVRTVDQPLRSAEQHLPITIMASALPVTA
jgi:hypothetical protein